MYYKFIGYFWRLEVKVVIYILGKIWFIMFKDKGGVYIFVFDGFVEVRVINFKILYIVYLLMGIFNLF